MYVWGGRSDFSVGGTDVTFMLHSSLKSRSKPSLGKFMAFKIILIQDAAVLGTIGPVPLCNFYAKYS
jgi:hypothetical protein